jgi:hypothetical protein
MMVRSVLLFHQQIVNHAFVPGDFEVGGASHKQSSSVLQYGTGREPKEIMTTSHNRQNMSSLDLQAEIQLFDSGGKLDVSASDAANKEIFSEANLVRTAGGGIDTVASHAKRLVTKAAILASKK